MMHYTINYQIFHHLPFEYFDEKLFAQQIEETLFLNHLLILDFKAFINHCEESINLIQFLAILNKPNYLKLIENKISMVPFSALLFSNYDNANFYKLLIYNQSIDFIKAYLHDEKAVEFRQHILTFGLLYLGDEFSHHSKNIHDFFWQNFTSELIQLTNNPEPFHVNALIELGYLDYIDHLFSKMDDFIRMELVCSYRFFLVKKLLMTNGADFVIQKLGLLITMPAIYANSYGFLTELFIKKDFHFIKLLFDDYNIYHLFQSYNHIALLRLISIAYSKSDVNLLQLISQSLEIEIYAQIVKEAITNKKYHLMEFLLDSVRLPYQSKLLAFNNYQSFKQLIELNEPFLFEKYFNQLTYDSKINLLTLDNGKFFRLMIRHNQHFLITKFTCLIGPNQFYKIIKYHDFEPMLTCLQLFNGDLLKFLLDFLNTNQLNQLFKSRELKIIRAFFLSLNNHSNQFLVPILLEHLSSHSDFDLTFLAQNKDNQILKCLSYLKFKEPYDKLIIRFLNIPELFSAMCSLNNHGSTLLMNDFIPYTINQLSQNILHIKETHLVIHIMHYLLKALKPSNERRIHSELKSLFELSDISEYFKKAQCSEQITSILKLTIEKDVEHIFEILMKNPSIKDTALDHNFFEAETEDLTYLAGFDESSMSTLNREEKKQVAHLLQRYNFKGNHKEIVAKYYPELMESITSKYQSAPAFILIPNPQFNKHPSDKNATDEHLKIMLPLDHESFQSLIQHDDFSEQDIKNAYKSYYIHKIHSAYRLFLKPNPWIDENAGFACRNAENSERWTDCEQYIFIMCLYFVALKDESFPPIDDFTIEKRLHLFLESFYYLQRAHNFDHNEQDDYKADNPSCIQGIQKRLPQMVLGHGLFKVINTEVLQQTINQSIYLHFKKIINSEKNATFFYHRYRAIAAFSEDSERYSTELMLYNFNIRQLIKEICHQLEKTFGKNFSSQKLKIHFKLDALIEKQRAISNSDFMAFYGSANLGNLIILEDEDVLSESEEESNFESHVYYR